MRNVTIAWMPTFRCNLVCAYCGGRGLPIAKHGSELPAEEWIRIFDDCPHTLSHVGIGGREPSVYRPLATVLTTTDWPFRMETNLRIHPSEWLKPELYSRLTSATASLHFHPDHPEADSFWEGIKWLQETVPHTWFGVFYVTLWRDLPDILERVKERTAELGAKLYVGTFDETFLFRDKMPRQNGRIASCSCGHDFVIVLPDSAVYRCIGHADFAIDCLGKLSDDGWGILHDDPQHCETLLCTSCDNCAKSDVITD